MNYKNTLGFALDSITRHLILAIISIILVAFSVLFVETLMCEYATLHTSEIEVKETLNTKEQQLFFLKSSSVVDQEYEGKLYEFRDEINKIDGVRTGEISYEHCLVDNTNAVYDLKEALGNVEDIEDYDDDTLMIPCLSITNNINICDVYTIEGDRITFDYEGDADNYGIYVGYEYADILPEGAVLTRTLQDRVIRYEVLGVLEKGSKWVGELSNISYSSYNKAVYNLDNYIIIESSDDNIYQSEGLYIYIEDYNDTQLIETIKEIANKYNQYLYIETVNQCFDKINEEFKDENFTIKVLMVFFSIVTISAMAVTVVANIYRDKKTYGVFYSVGFSTKDLVRMSSIENGIKYMLGAVIAYAYAAYVYLAPVYEEQLMVNRIVMFKYVAPTVIIYVIILSVISALISAKILKKYKPVQLIGAMREE